jgi:hypothetical protein
MAARLSALRASRTLPPGFFIFKDSWYSFLLEAESTPGAPPPTIPIKKKQNQILPGKESNGQVTGRARSSSG